MTRNAAMIGEFLRARRGQLSRADLGLQPVGGRRTSGLRREEVAYLSGVSVTWYTWLEQGRDITPSRQVIDALARTLRLSGPEHAYILSLAGYSAPHPTNDPISRTAPAHVQRLLDAMAGFPAYAIAPDWSVSGWNTASAALYPNLATAPTADRNLLWLLFADPYVRELLPDWEIVSRQHVAAFRAEAGQRLSDPPFADLVARLLDNSDAFRAAWRRNDVEPLGTRERRFRHPVAGDILLEQNILTPSDQRDLHLIVYIPLPETDAPARLRRLLDP